MSNDLSTLDTVTGEMQTLVNGYVKVILFKVQLPGPGTLYKEDGIFRNNVPGVNRIGFPGSIASLQNGRPEVCGTVFSGKYSLTPGSFLKIFVKAHRRRSFPESASLFIRMRPSAALRRITVSCPEDPKATISEFSITGRFDLVKPIEAIAAGCRIPEQFKLGYAPTGVNRLMRFSVLSPETATRTVVRTASGEEKEVIVAKRRRRLGGVRSHS